MPPDPILTCDTSDCSILAASNPIELIVVSDAVVVNEIETDDGIFTQGNLLDCWSISTYSIINHTNNCGVIKVKRNSDSALIEVYPVNSGYRYGFKKVNNDICVYRESA